MFNIIPIEAIDTNRELPPYDRNGNVTPQALQKYLNLYSLHCVYNLKT